MKRIVWTLALALASATSGAAAQDVTDGDTAGDDLQRIVAQQHALKSDLAAGKHGGLTPREVVQVQRAQQEVLALADGKSDFDALSMDEKVRLENALERINALIVNTREGDDAQNVCWRERVMGTGVKQTRCGTKAEMREAREGARDWMERPKTCGARCG